MFKAPPPIRDHSLDDGKANVAAEFDAGKPPHKRANLPDDDLAWRGSIKGQAVEREPWTRPKS
jgi:hypothetical protein